MAYNPQIDQRIGAIVENWPANERKKMFGGICRLLNGNMFCGVLGDYLILRLGEEQAARALLQPQVKVFDITGRPMKGWVMVAEDAFVNDEDLERWLAQARQFNALLPPRTR